MKNKKDLIDSKFEDLKIDAGKYKGKIEDEAFAKKFIGIFLDIKYNKISYPQYKFAERSYLFTKGTKRYHINTGDMGLGKSLAMVIVMKILLKEDPSIQFTFTATPYTNVKSEHTQEHEKIGSGDEVIPWQSKQSVCIKKIEDPNFDITKCTDDCEYRSHLESNGRYSFKCKELLSTLPIPLDTEDYYKTNGKKNCLLSVIRLGLKTRTHIIGDYFGILNSKMLKIFIENNRRDSLNYKNDLYDDDFDDDDFDDAKIDFTKRFMENSVAIIDEAPLFPFRAMDFFSRERNFTSLLKKVKYELTETAKQEGTILKAEYLNMINYLDIFQKVIDDLILNAKLKIKKNSTITKYGFNDFKNDFNNLFSLSYDDYDAESDAYEDMMNYFNIYLIKSNAQLKYEDEESDPSLKKLFMFMRYWEDIKGNNVFKTYCEYKKDYNKKNKESMILKLECINPATLIKNSLDEWKKVTFMSGTMPDKNQFLRFLGINSQEIIYSPLLQEHSMKKNMLILAHKDLKFTLAERDKTYNDYNFKDTLKKMFFILKNKRSIVFVNSIADIPKMKNIIDSLGIFQKNEIMEIKGTAQEFETEKNIFNKLDQGVGIFTINGRVEGMNLINESNISIQNSIIIGYPHPVADLIYKDRRRYWGEFIKNEILNDPGLNKNIKGGESFDKELSKIVDEEVERIVRYGPASSKLFQAIKRIRMRKLNNVAPVGILIGSDYSEKRDTYKNLFDEIKVKPHYNYGEFIEALKKIKK